MKTIVLLASPNGNGRTKKLVESYCEAAQIEYELADIYKMSIKPCIDCGYCSKNKGECSLKDDMTEIYKKIEAYDNVILAGPMYFGMFPAPLIALIDRTQMIWCKKYVFNERPEIKRNGMIISTAGNEWADMYDAMEKIGKYFFNTINCKLLDVVTVTNTDKEKEQDLKNDIECVGRRKGEILREKLF